jgi:hypothetical protein
MAALIQSPAKCEVRSVIRFLNAKCERPAEIHRLWQIANRRVTIRQLHYVILKVSKTKIHEAVTEKLGYRKS